MKTVPELLASIPTETLPRVRCWFRSDAGVTNWGSWLIAPTSGYWELQGFGPFQIADVKQCELLFRSVDPTLIDLLKENGFHPDELDLLKWKIEFES